MRSLRPFKFVIQAVLLEEEDGVIVGERPTEAVTHYSIEAVEKWLQDFTEQVKSMNGEAEKA